MLSKNCSTLLTIGFTNLFHRKPASQTQIAASNHTDKKQNEEEDDGDDEKTSAKINRGNKNVASNCRLFGVCEGEKASERERESGQKKIVHLL